MSLTDADADEKDLKYIDEANYQKLTDKVSKIGYADGVSDGRESVFQSGFNLGYADGLRTAFELQKYKDFFAHDVGDERKAELTAYMAMRIPDAKNAAHIQYMKDMTQSLDIVSKQQQDYVDELAANLERTLPITANLLKPK